MGGKCDHKLYASGFGRSAKHFASSKLFFRTNINFVMQNLLKFSSVLCQILFLKPTRKSFVTVKILIKSVVIVYATRN